LFGAFAVHDYIIGHARRCENRPVIVHPIRLHGHGGAVGQKLFDGRNDPLGSLEIDIDSNFC
jgi:hypothetical protein